MAAVGARNYETLAENLLSVRSDYEGRKKQAEKQCEASKALGIEKEKSAKQQKYYCAANTCLSVVSGLVPAGKSGVGVVAVAGGAPAVASIPLIGSALTTTTTSTVSATGIWGYLGATVTTTAVAFNPVGIMVGVGFAAGFGIMAVKTWSDASLHQLEKEAALKEKEAAETKAKSCEDMVNKSAKRQELAGDMAKKARSHESLWQGLSMAAGKAADTFAQGEKIDPTGARRRRFDEKMIIYANDVCQFVQAIDEYLFYLSKNDFFPPNFPLQRELGVERVRELELQWNSTARQLRESAKGRESVQV